MSGEPSPLTSPTNEAPDTTRELDVMRMSLLRSSRSSRDISLRHCGIVCDEVLVVDVDAVLVVDVDTVLVDKVDAVLVDEEDAVLVEVSCVVVEVVVVVVVVLVERPHTHSPVQAPLS